MAILIRPAASNPSGDVIQPRIPACAQTNQIGPVNAPHNEEPQSLDIQNQKVGFPMGRHGETVGFATTKTTATWPGRLCWKAPELRLSDDGHDLLDSSHHGERLN